MELLNKTYRVISFIFYYLYKLVVANLFIAYDILTPRMLINPGFLTIRLKLKSDFGLLLFTNLVSMTPGTLSMDIDENRDKLVVHLLYMDRSEETIEEMNKMMEKIKRIVD
jgi:multisubunit Na+/H+ antiporter MnhE subunit